MTVVSHVASASPPTSSQSLQLARPRTQPSMAHLPLVGVASVENHPSRAMIDRVLTRAECPEVSVLDAAKCPAIAATIGARA